MRFENWDICKQLLNLGKGLPSNEDLKFAESDCNLGFMVGVSEFLGVPLMQLCGKLLVRMDLEG
jgi:hypothetical protein